MRWAAILILIGGVTVVGLAIWQALQDKPAPEQPTSSSTTTSQSAPGETPTFARLYASQIADVAAPFTFSLEIPTGWQAEAVREIEAISIYDPGAAGDSNLEKSQLFIRHFEANAFLTLQTVTIHDRDETTVDGRPAVRYEIEKKSGVTDFPSQPSWRNQRHIVTDVRVTDDNPSTFYVIAKRPDLADTTYQQLLDSLKVTDEPLVEPGLLTPTAEFESRITKKRFGTYVTPENSPVSPERFTGFHTGVDVEYGDVGDEVPVRAIANGTVTLAKIAQGYGGVVVVTHAIDDRERSTIYGHLDPAILPTVGATITRGQELGRLGDGRTDETDGERKHLHFAVRVDTGLVLLGYVQRESDLSGWLDPLILSYSSS
ncbi:M23 family metallopeptidase [Candidatus Berkelbacteria bacterium]|nr:M23 family metallopeptidase [Candidatus Berkelbacteria bacterium]